MRVGLRHAGEHSLGNVARSKRHLHYKHLVHAFPIRDARRSSLNRVCYRESLDIVDKALPQCSAYLQMPIKGLLRYTLTHLSRTR